MLTLRRDGYGWRVPPHYYSHTLTINPATCSITHTCLIKWLIRLRMIMITFMILLKAEVDRKINFN